MLFNVKIIGDSLYLLFFNVSIENQLNNQTPSKKQKKGAAIEALGPRAPGPRAQAQRPKSPKGPRSHGPTGPRAHGPRAHGPTAHGPTAQGPTGLWGPRRKQILKKSEKILKKVSSRRRIFMPWSPWLLQCLRVSEYVSLEIPLKYNPL